MGYIIIVLEKDPGNPISIEIRYKNEISKLYDVLSGIDDKGEIIKTIEISGVIQVAHVDYMEHVFFTLFVCFPIIKQFKNIKEIYAKACDQRLINMDENDLIQYKNDFIQYINGSILQSVKFCDHVMKAWDWMDEYLNIPIEERRLPLKTEHSIKSASKLT